jgi:hypothetical protein
LIYNFVQYLRANYPTETFYPNEEKATDSQGVIPDRRVIAKESGGVETPWIGFRRQTVQLLIRDVDPPKARLFAYTLYNKINSVFGLVLPQITVDGNVFAEIETAQITSIQLPQSMGRDENSRSVFVFNITVIWEG